MHIYTGKHRKPGGCLYAGLTLVVLIVTALAVVFSGN